MAVVDPRVIQNLLDEIARLESDLTGTGNMESRRITEKRFNELRAAAMQGRVFDANRWSQLSADRQKDLRDQLTSARDGLLAKGTLEESRLSSYPRQGEAGSKPSFIWLAIFGLIFAATLLSLIR